MICLINFVTKCINMKNNIISGVPYGQGNMKNPAETTGMRYKNEKSKSRQNPTHQAS